MAFKYFTTLKSKVVAGELVMGKERYLKAASILLLIAPFFVSYSEAQAISDSTVSLVMMCGPLDSTSKNLTDCPKAIDLLQIKSDHGDAYATFYLAMAYSRGIVVAQNDKKSFSLMLKAANEGDVAAFYYVGASYMFGIGTQVDGQSALTWLGKSAFSGDVSAEYILGELYSDRKYGHQDLKLSYMWYEVAYDSGMSSAKTMRDIVGALLSDDDRQTEQSAAARLAEELESQPKK